MWLKTFLNQRMTRTWPRVAVEVTSNQSRSHWKTSGRVRVYNNIYYYIFCVGVVGINIYVFNYSFGFWFHQRRQSRGFRDFFPTFYCRPHNIMCVYTKPNQTLFVFSPIFRRRTFPADEVGKKCLRWRRWPAVRKCIFGSRPNDIPGAPNLIISKEADR